MTRAQKQIGTASTIVLEGRRLELSSLDKVLWPRAGFTKGDMIDYYRRVAPALLPHIAGRALTLGRFPDGVESAGFAQTECRGRPDWLPTRPLRVRSGEVRNYCVVDDAPALVWVANQNAIELHPFLGREELGRPTLVAFDLDPGPPAGLVECCSVAIRLRAALDGFGLVSFPKTSGSVGLHVYVPLDGDHGYGETKQFARAMARRLADEHPALVVEAATRSLRAGKVMVDWRQNDAMRSTVAAYSLRATPWPTVSTPLTWEEVEHAAAVRKSELLTFGPGAVLARVESFGDLFRGVVESRQALPPAHAGGLLS